MTIKVILQQRAGHAAYLPGCSQAHLITKLTRRSMILPDDLAILQELGVKVKVT